MDIIDCVIFLTFLFFGVAGLGAAADLTVLWTQRRGPFNPYRRIR